ncbi:hypothetical protein SAMN05216414_10919 [Nitrosovibrio sp. Nv17]|nr:hypothetical protein SAMN05216414_10919 [Nitrosovibrio sp. Nv17]
MDEGFSHLVCTFNTMIHQVEIPISRAMMFPSGSPLLFPYEICYCILDESGAEQYGGFIDLNIEFCYVRANTSPAGQIFGERGG